MKKREREFVVKMVKVTTERKEKLVSALSLWRSYDATGALNTQHFDTRTDDDTGLVYTPVAYDGHGAEDGRVRIFAYFARPEGNKKCPAILLLKEVDKPFDFELVQYFVEKGYAVLVPDYSGPLSSGLESCEEVAFETEEDSKAKQTPDDGAREEFVPYTVYPKSLEYANYEKAQGLYDVEGVASDATCWYQWT